MNPCPFPFSVSAESKPKTAAQINNYEQVKAYLYGVRHANLDALSQQPTRAIIEDSYRQFYVFMQDSMPLTEWFPLFREYVYETITRLGRPQYEADWVLRSAEFVNFCSALKSVSEKA